MKIIYEPTKYYKYAFDYKFSLDTLEFCRYLKQKLGWKEFGFFEKKWRFNDLRIIEMIKNRYPQLEIDTSIDNVVQEEKIKKAKEELIIQKANEIKKKKNSTLEIKGLKKELYPFQKIGVEFFINNNGRAILADTMGLGKTAQAIAYLIHQKIPKTLVICPSSVKYVWENEILKWSALKPLIIDSRTKISSSLELFKKHDVFVINYDILKRHFDALISFRFDCLICDEFHYIKNNAAQRTKLVKRIGGRIPHILLLSGTPILSRPVELFNGLQLMDKSTWPDWYKFTVRYCQGHQGFFGWDCRGASNIDELQSRISRYFLRRTKEEVLPELPPKKFIDIPVELESKQKFEYDLVMDSFIDYLQEIKNKSNAEIAKTMQAEKLVKLNELRIITSQGKVKVAEQIISDITNNEEKIVVFSSYREPLKYLESKFGKSCVLLTGETPEFMRKKIIKSFQTKDNVKIFLGGIKSAGVGITLTAASNVLFIDYSWVPADHAQAVDRTHRIGQKADSINVYQLYSKGTIDEKMKNILEQKQDLFNKLMNEPLTASTKSINLVDDLINDIQNKS